VIDADSRTENDCSNDQLDTQHAIRGTLQKSDRKEHSNDDHPSHIALPRLCAYSKKHCTSREVHRVGKEQLPDEDETEHREPKQAACHEKQTFAAELWSASQDERCQKDLSPGHVAEKERGREKTQSEDSVCSCGEPSSLDHLRSTRVWIFGFIQVVVVADLVATFLWFLLLSFVGLLLLPVINRKSVFALDRHVAGRVNKREPQETIGVIDKLTEQDPTRSVSAESIFQPIPCPERRLLSLEKDGPPRVLAWNMARTTLYLSWAFGGPLARAVHCNVGRPELWAMLPSD
jgi:hypothetical protein